jgi:hypothetical protein
MHLVSRQRDGPDVALGGFKPNTVT